MKIDGVRVIVALSLLRKKCYVRPGDGNYLAPTNTLFNISGISLLQIVRVVRIQIQASFIVNENLNFAGSDGLVAQADKNYSGILHQVVTFNRM